MQSKVGQTFFQFFLRDPKVLWGQVGVYISCFILLSLVDKAPRYLKQQLNSNQEWTSHCFVAVHAGSHGLIKPAANYIMCKKHKKHPEVTKPYTADFLAASTHSDNMCWSGLLQAQTIIWPQLWADSKGFISIHKLTKPGCLSTRAPLKKESPAPIWLLCSIIDPALPPTLDPTISQIVTFHIPKASLRHQRSIHQGPACLWAFSGLAPGGTPSFAIVDEVPPICANP